MRASAGKAHLNLMKFSYFYFMKEQVWTVYVIKCSDKTYYVGCTNNLENRLERHSKGQVISTKSRLPIALVTHIVFRDKYKAYAFEKYLKSGSGRAFMNKRFI